MTNKHILRELERIYRILEAGEKGYAVSAVNVNNCGLKVLFKSFAQQRARFKEELLDEMKRRLGNKVKPRSGLLGVIHRGRISIFAALTIGRNEREMAILKQVLVGERFALRAYKRVLQKELHPETLELISRQLAEIMQAFERVSLLYGKEGKQLLIKLFDTEIEVDSALLEMKNAGLQPEVIERLDFKAAVEFYDGKSATTNETMISGVVLGAFWGGLVGILSGIGMQAAGFSPFETVTGQNIWAFVILAGIFAGELVGAMLGFALGAGLSGEDAYQYELSAKRGKILLLTKVDAFQAPTARQIMSYR